MGMSASQARLLSITARLTNNEFRSQTATNAKLRLAQETQDATTEYIDALNSQKLVFMNYDDEGAATTTNLTPTLLYAYEPLKNQYIMRNNSGEVLVSGEDAKNFDETDNLFQFLERYELAHNITYTSPIEEEIQEESPNPEHEIWINKCKEIDAINKENENWIPPVWDEELEKAKYTTINYNDYEIKQISDSEEGNTLFDVIWMYGQPLFHLSEVHTVDWPENEAQPSPDPKYNFVYFLENVLDLQIENDGSIAHFHNIYQSTAGKYEMNMYGYQSDLINDFGYSPKYCFVTDLIQDVSGHIFNTIVYYGQSKYFKPLSDLISNGYDPGDGNGVQMFYASEIHADDDSSEVEKLMSDYYLEKYKEDKFQLTYSMLMTSNYTYDDSGNIVLKTLKQKVIDLMYMSENGFEHDSYWTFRERSQEYDDWFNNFYIPIAELFKKELENYFSNLGVSYDEPYFDEDAYNEAKQNALTPPEKLSYPEEPPEYIIETKTIITEQTDTLGLIISDKDKSQWYINLWFAMNGSNTANLAKEINFDSPDSIWSVVPESLRSTYRYYVPDSEKNEKGKNYKVLEDNLASSAEWLQFAIEQGIVTLEQAVYTRPAEDGKRVLDLKSEGIIWTPLDAPSNAKDLIYIDDEAKIARAEVKYKKAVKEIQNKDKKYDQDLKKLDTEHNALQTEYESIKSVIQKNAERSFKLFS